MIFHYLFPFLENFLSLVTSEMKLFATHKVAYVPSVRIH